MYGSNKCLYRCYCQATCLCSLSFIIIVLRILKTALHRVLIFPVFAVYDVKSTDLRSTLQWKGEKLVGPFHIFYTAGRENGNSKAGYNRFFNRLQVIHPGYDVKIGKIDLVPF